MRYMTEYEAHEQYDEMLDECYPETECAGLKYRTSRALRELDPTAYRCGFMDWCAAEGITTDADEADEADPE
ncbi:MAG: hypothetical protein ACYDB1_01130 [Acidiferrobacteraceae bacterium]